MAMHPTMRSTTQQYWCQCRVRTPPCLHWSSEFHAHCNTAHARHTNQHNNANHNSSNTNPSLAAASARDTNCSTGQLTNSPRACLATHAIYNKQPVNIVMTHTYNSHRPTFTICTLIQTADIDGQNFNEWIAAHFWQVQCWQRFL